jgi:excisionase family DNA binding protein
MFTVKEVAEKLRVSQATVYNAVESGDLPHHRIGQGRWTIGITEEQLHEVLARTRVHTCSRVRLRNHLYRPKTRL